MNKQSRNLKILKQNSKLFCFKSADNICQLSAGMPSALFVGHQQGVNVGLGQLEKTWVDREVPVSSLGQGDGIALKRGRCQDSQGALTFSVWRLPGLHPYAFW